MLRNYFIIVPILVVNLTACTAPNSDSLAPQAPAQTANNSGALPGPPQNISLLPLSQGLPVKYSRLQVTCITTTVAGTAQPVVTPKVLKLDLFSNFTVTPTLLLASTTGPTRYQFSFPGVVGLENGTFDDTLNPGKTYIFKNAAKLTLTAADPKAAPIVLVENVAADVIDTTGAFAADGSQLHLTIACTLEGDIKPPYQNDSSLVGK